MDYREEIINSLVEVCKKARSEGFDSAREIYTKQVDSGYKKGLEDAWDFFKKIYSMDVEETDNIYGSGKDPIDDYTPLEALQKLKEYEEQQKQAEKCEKCTKEISAECVVDGCEFEPKQTDDTDSNEIKVGDEIYSDETDMTAVVHRIDAWGRYQCFNSNGAQFILDKETYDEYWHKTYKYYPQIAEVLEQLRGDKDADSD